MLVIIHVEMIGDSIRAALPIDISIAISVPAEKKKEEKKKKSE